MRVTAAAILAAILKNSKRSNKLAGHHSDSDSTLLPLLCNVTLAAYWTRGEISGVCNLFTYKIEYLFSDDHALYPTANSLMRVMW